MLQPYAAQGVSRPGRERGKKGCARARVCVCVCVWQTAKESVREAQLHPGAGGLPVCGYMDTDTGNGRHVKAAPKSHHARQYNFTLVGKGKRAGMRTWQREEQSCVEISRRGMCLSRIVPYTKSVQDTICAPASAIRRAVLVIDPTPKPLRIQVCAGGCTFRCVAAENSLGSATPAAAEASTTISTTNHHKQQQSKEKRQQDPTVPQRGTHTRRSVGCTVYSAANSLMSITPSPSVSNASSTPAT